MNIQCDEDAALGECHRAQESPKIVFVRVGLWFHEGDVPRLAVHGRELESYMLICGVLGSTLSSYLNII